MLRWITNLATRSMRLISLLNVPGAALLLCLFASSAAAGEPAAAAKPKVRVTDAWIRLLPAGLPSAGYLTLVNDGDTAAILRGATSPNFEDVSIHQTVRDGARVGMKPAERV